MGSRWIRLLPLAIATLALPCCKSDGIPPETMAQIRQAQLRMLTVDGHVSASAGARIMSRMEAGGLDAALFVVSVRQGEPTPSGFAAARKKALDGIRRIRKTAEARRSFLSLAGSQADAYRLEKEGRHAAFIGLGNAYALGTDVSLVPQYYEKGVRSLTLCGVVDNAVCDSALDPSNAPDRGLTDFGRRVVAECNRVGMVIDLANASEKTFFDVLAVSRAPVVVSRSAARALCDHPGNLTDEMIRAVCGAGGVVLVSFEPRRLIGKAGASRATVVDIADHIEYVYEAGGEYGVGIGSGFGKGGGVSGCRDVSEILNLTVELLRRGHSEREVEMILGGNIMRVVRDAGDLTEKR